MVVKNAQGNIVKTVNFEYLLVETGVYTLKRLIIDNVEKYDFEYSPSTQTTLFAKDYWGYKNDGPLFDNTIPSITLEDEHKTKIYGGGNSRLPSLGAAQDGVLIKIVYPTGGWTRFSYELNQCKHNSEMRYGGGLRVSKMTSADENGNLIEKSYEYGNDGSGYCDVHAEDAMRATDDVYVEYYSVGQSYYGHYRRRSFNFEFNDGLSYLAGKGIQYSLITEYTYNTTKGENGKIEYYYSLGLPDIIAEYPSRGEVHRAPDGKVFVSSFNSFWNTSKLTGKKIYVKKGGGFELQKEIENNYDKTKTGQLRGLSVYPAMEFYNDYSYGYEKEAAYNGYEVFRFADYYIHIGKEQLSSTKETDYFRGGKVEKQTNYYYNDKGMPVKNVETYNAETITKEWTYYYENETGMKNLNLLSPLKNFKTDYKNGTNTSNTIDFNTFTYQNWGGNVWAPSKIHTFSSGNTTPYITYHKYDDYGNPLHKS